MAAAPNKNVLYVFVVLMMMVVVLVDGVITTNPNPNPPASEVGTASWCVVRSEASIEALQSGLDYACGSGADCSPIQPDGLCYLPNTIQAHASYAFNSYFQRKSMSPGSCDFSGTANVAKTDPSYGACVYPSSLSTAGGTITPTTPPSTPTTGSQPSTMTPIFGGLSPQLTPGSGGTTNATVKSKASFSVPVSTPLMTTSFFITVFTFNSIFISLS